MNTKASLLSIPDRINPDLQNARNSATFDPRKITYMLDGGEQKTKRRKEIEEVVHNDPVFDSKDDIHKSAYERYDAAVHKGVKLFDLAAEHGWDMNDLRIAGKQTWFDVGFGVHGVMFIPTIERLGTEAQKSKWLPLAMTLKVIGTYAQTEMGHGTNLRKLETTAVYDTTTQEFVINTPLPSGMKFWPGGLGKSSNHALVNAMLLIKGQSYGMYSFIVPIRSLETHMPLPGVDVGDIGPKFGSVVSDNGYLILQNVRIPRENMLMKYARVSPDGTFSKSGNDKAGYGTMSMVRVNIVMWAYMFVSTATTIAIRYGAVRRQSEYKPGEAEPQIIEYQTQQHKLFPNLALAYAFYFAKEYMFNFYEKIYEEQLKKGNFKMLPELHSQSSGLKAFCTDLAFTATETCRRSCGGHGYLLSSGLPNLVRESAASVTYEGENTVMYLQTARYLMKAFASGISGEKVEGSVSYLCQEPEPSPIVSEADCLNGQYLCNTFKRRAYFVIQRVARKLQGQLESGTPHYKAWNNNAVDLVAAAKAHLDGFIAISFIEYLQHLPLDANEKRVMTLLSRLHALHRINEGAAEFLESGAINIEQLEYIRNQEAHLLQEIRPEAVALVDAFDIHDKTLNSTLGSFDGNVYERIYEAAQRSTLNKEQVHPAIFKYIKPFTAKL